MEYTTCIHGASLNHGCTYCPGGRRIVKAECPPHAYQLGHDDGAGNDLCTQCGRPEPRIRWNVWARIERADEYHDNEEYHDVGEPVKIGTFDSLREADRSLINNAGHTAYPSSGNPIYPSDAWYDDEERRLATEYRCATVEDEREARERFHAFHRARQHEEAAIGDSRELD